MRRATPEDDQQEEVRRATPEDDQQEEVRRATPEDGQQEEVRRATEPVVPTPGPDLGGRRCYYRGSLQPMWGLEEVVKKN